MSDAAPLAFGIAVPWLAGFAVVRALLAWQRDRDTWVEVGYGHFVGVLLVTLVMRCMNAIGMPLAVVPATIVMAIVAVGGLVYAARRSSTDVRGAETTPEPLALRWIAAVALALIAIRIGTLAVDVLLRPLFAWDAWSQWGTKAKVWSSLREIAPFMGYDEWLARTRPGYTDTAPNYPATIPLLQTWMTLVLGRWDDALMNLPWLAAFVALGAGLYGQMRRLGAGASWSIVATYLVLSLPLLDTHVALAGYADLHVAAAYALAVLALAQWEATRARGALVLLASAALLLPLLKLPGIAWIGTLALGTVIVVFGTTPWRMGGLAAAVLAVTVAIGFYFGSGKVTPDAAATQYRIVESLLQHLYAFGSWNLAWYLVPLTVALAWREALALKATTVALACGFAFLAWTFFFTQAGDWVVDYTTVNRALLHIAPAAIAYAALLAHARAARPVVQTAAVPVSSAMTQAAAADAGREVA